MDVRGFQNFRFWFTVHKVPSAELDEPSNGIQSTVCLASADTVRGADVRPTSFANFSLHNEERG
jgi:hypothetical protein